jgi:hypothetical protein
MAKDPWIAAALAALQRACRRAEDIARQTGTPLVFARNGQPILVDPGPPPPDDDATTPSGAAGFVPGEP